MQIVHNDRYKALVSDEVNYLFDTVNGNSFVWGKTYEDDPAYSPYGPFIADIELTTICKGPGGVPCPFCYKANTPEGHNMSFETFKTVFSKLPNTLQQIAFGVDASCTSNPDTFKIFEYCRENNVVPNVTVADIDDETAIKLASVCGAVSVSRYANKDICYNSVERLSDCGLKQVNLHVLLTQELLTSALETVYDAVHDPRLSGLNAIVFLALKKVGRGVGYTQVTQEHFDIVVNHCKRHGVRFGFDSCSANKFLKSVNNEKLFKFYNMFAEKCESTRFSAYINVHGKFNPCSFLDDGEGLDVLTCNDFITDIWNHEKTVAFRNKNIECSTTNKACQIFEV